MSSTTDNHGMELNCPVLTTSIRPKAKGYSLPNDSLLSKALIP